MLKQIKVRQFHRILRANLSRSQSSYNLENIASSPREAFVGLNSACRDRRIDANTVANTQWAVKVSGIRQSYTKTHLKDATEVVYATIVKLQALLGNEYFLQLHTFCRFRILL
jgi:hypothetical protein